MATVIGPTPPGIGVANEAFSIIFSKSESPFNFTSNLEIATSITIDPFF